MSLTIEPALKEQVREAIARENVKFIDLQFIDILGIVKSVTIPAGQWEDTLSHGKWFDGSSVEGFARIAESDMYLMPDLETFRVIPWTRGVNTTARVICWVHTPDGEQFVGDPRYVLARQIEAAKALGYDFNTGPELEFFLFRSNDPTSPTPLPHDQGGYFDLSTDLASHVRQDMVNTLEQLGIEVETSHHEVAVGQHEIDFKYGHALTTADNCVTFKYALKAVAQKYDLYCTFMPKPIFGINGSGMHTHMSLFRDGETAMYDANDPYGLTKTARHFIAGVLHHAKAINAVLNPTVNSYKRLVPGYEAPVYISWARNNRSALIRVPRINPHATKATRIELRSPDPTCNPYLAFALMLAAGLDGVKRELAPPAPVEENLYHMGPEERTGRQIDSLNGSLGEALDALKQSDLARETLGEHLFNRFIEAKTQEWDEYRTYVTQWELDRYLPLY
ncbi:MAG TPA: type I glutamate--ammonia ligase [Oscillatoriaceae cyanobacterium]